jgi:hypothetical protein
VVSTHDGQLFGLDIDTGYTLWAYAIGRDVVAEPVIARGWVYATTKDGYVIALNVGDSSLDGWHMFGGTPAHNGPGVAPPESTTASVCRQLPPHEMGWAGVGWGIVPTTDLQPHPNPPHGT